MSLEKSNFIKIKAPKNSLSIDQSVYLYLKGELRDEALRDFEERLRTDSLFSERVKQSRLVFQYSNQLSQVQVTDELKQKILESTTYWAGLAKKLNRKNWPREISLFAESLSLGLIVFFVLQAMPWTSMKNWWSVGIDSIRIEREKKHDLSVSTTTLQQPTQTDEKLKAPQAQTSNAPAASPSVGLAVKPTQNLPTQKTTIPEKPTIVPPVETQVARPTPSSPSAVKTSPQTLGSTINGSQRKGYVFRLFMDLSRLDQVTQPIAQKIKGLGGEKAGDVPLGWKRGEGSYYHFTLPEANYTQLLTQLKSYGPVRISRDVHPRIMPEGTIRLILWIESLDGGGRASSPVNKSNQSGENKNSDPSSNDSEGAGSNSGQ